MNPAASGAVRPFGDGDRGVFENAVLCVYQVASAGSLPPPQNPNRDIWISSGEDGRPDGRGATHVPYAVARSKQTSAEG